MKAITFNSYITFIKALDMRVPRANVIMYEILRFNATWEGKNDDDDKTNFKTFLEKNAITSFYVEDILEIFNEHDVTLFVPFWGYTIIREKFNDKYFNYVFFTDENEMIYEMTKDNIEKELHSMKIRYDLLKDTLGKMK